MRRVCFPSNFFMGTSQKLFPLFFRGLDSVRKVSRTRIPNREIDVAILPKKFQENYTIRIIHAVIINFNEFEFHIIRRGTRGYA